MRENVSIEAGGGRFIIDQEWYFKKEVTRQNFANCNKKWRKQTEEQLQLRKKSPLLFLILTRNVILV